MTVGPVLRYLLCSLLLLSGVTSVNVSANDVYTDGSVFTHDVDGIQLTLKILSIADRTIQVGDGKAPAIPTETSASLAIPPTIMLDGSTYKIVNIGTSAFSGCTGITDVVIPDGVQMIRSKTFYGCTALKSVSIPNSVYRLGNSSFYGCTALESIELPVGLIGVDGYPGVGDNAFQLCSSLKRVTSNTLSPSALGVDAFAGISPDCVLYIPVGKLTVYHKGGWTKDVFGGGVVEVGDVEENYCLENGVTADFMKNVVYPDDDYSYTKITDYTTQATSYMKDQPMPVRIEGSVTDEGECLILETSAGGLIARSDTFIVGQRVLEIWNLIPQTSYTYKLYVLNSDKTKQEIRSGSFRTEGQMRMMKIDNMSNFRDIGGWKLPKGKSVKYDKIFRCGELAVSTQLITASGIHELLKVQGIEVEIDFGGYSDTSPVEDDLEFVHGDDYQITFYVDGVKNKKVQYKNCFEKVVNSLREGKKLIFHCSAGADRTGCFAFLLEGLLGVSESDLAKDYELTSFYQDQRYRTAEGKGYNKLVDYVKNTFSGNTINEKIEQMALTSFGISQKDLDDFRALMSDPAPGDANGDGEVDERDLNAIVSYIMGFTLEYFDEKAADLNGDRKVNVADIVEFNK